MTEMNKIGLKYLIERLHLTETQASSLWPNGPDSPNGFPGGMLKPRTDTRSWAEREKEKDDRGYTRVR